MVADWDSVDYAEAGYSAVEYWLLPLFEVLVDLEGLP